MVPTLKRSKTAMVTLIAGGVLGALAMATVLKTNIVPSAFAGPQGSMKAVAGISTESMANLRDLDASFASLAEFIEPSVVHIRSESKSTRDLMGRAMPMGGEGSGVVFRADGWILTNDHVVNGFDKVTVVMSDGKEYPGTVRRAEDSDLAVIKINATNLPAASFADSSNVKPGQFAIAVGSPFGLENTLTIGHVSAIGRSNPVPDARVAGGGRFYPDLIQTDAAINQGNSGGPLLNVDGQVIGINSAIFSSTGGSVGIGFAIPSNQARLIADMLIEKGKITRGYLGLVPTDMKPYQRKEKNIEGAIVETIPPDSPASKAGIRKDDILLRVGETPIKRQLDVRNAMLRYAPGTTVPVEVMRGTERKTFQVKIGAVPKPVAQREPNPKDSPFGQRFQMPDLDELMPKGFGSNPEENSDVQPLREGKARLGVGIGDISDETRKEYKLPTGVQGAVVTSIEPGSVAEKLGLEPGDVIEQLGDKTIRSGQDLVKAMEGVKWGESRQMKWGRYTDGAQFTQSRSVKFE